MNEIIKNIEAEQLKKDVPQFNVGDTVRVHALIKEGNRERIQIFEGTVLKKQGGSTRATFTVRKASNGVGVEKTWPLHSPHVKEVEVIRRGKVRRAFTGDVPRSAFGNEVNTNSDICCADGRDDCLGSIFLIIFSFSFSGYVIR